MTDEAWRGGSGPSPRFAFSESDGDPPHVALRTTIMSSPLFSLDGMISGRHALVLDEVLDRVVIGSDGRLLVAMVDVLAIARLDRDADVLLVEFVDGTSRALRMADVLERDRVSIELRIDGRVGPGAAVWYCRLWSEDFGTSPVVASIRATTFAAFVGLR
jgi:hypothetical protein